jgi:integrase
MATFIITPHGRCRATVRRKGFKRQARTFPTKTMAKAWAERIEAEITLQIVKGESTASALTVRELIDWFLQTAGAMRPISRTQRGNLSRLAEGLGDIQVRRLTAGDIVDHASRRREGRHIDKRGATIPACGGATLGVEMTFLGEVLKLGRSLKKIALAGDPLRDARDVMNQYRLISKSKKRFRRPTEQELALLRAHFSQSAYRRAVPMDIIMEFAIGTTRRESEITRLAWADLNTEQRTITLRDVKHPKRKAGNDKTFPLLGGMFDLAQSQPRIAECIFPYNPKSISAAFTRACLKLRIDDLHFHDLRHEGTSRLFEAGYSIEQVAMVTLHESWEDLKRYTQIRPESLHRDQLVAKG